MFGERVLELLDLKTNTIVPGVMLANMLQCIHLLVLTVGEVVDSYRCIGAAEAADPSLGSPVEPEEREDMDVEAVAHGLVRLVVHLQEQHVRVLLGELGNLRDGIHRSSSAHGRESAKSLGVL